MSTGTAKILHILRPDAGRHSIERVFADIRAHAPHDIAIAAWTCPHPSRGFWPRLRGAWAARAQKADIYHVTGDAHYLTAFLPRRRAILTIHDCEFVDRAKGLKRKLLWLFWLRLPTALAGRITVISEATKADLCRHVPHLSADRVHVIPNPVSPVFQPHPPNAHLGPLRILQIGTKANKNLKNLALALCDLPVAATLIGPATPEARAAMALADFPVTWHDTLSEAELLAAYRDCDIVSLCSTSEGFGLPILEAQAMGRPVITSNRAPMRDVAGGAAVLVDPEEPADMRKGFARLISNADLRADLAAKGLANTARAHPGAIAGQYAALYQDMAAATRAKPSRHAPAPLGLTP